MADESAARARIVEIAGEWIGTPFHDLARVKGVGCDCAQLVAAVYEEAGILEPVDTGHYSPQFFLHHGEERLINFILRHAREIDEPNVMPGDIVVYKVGRVFAHAAIVIDWPREIIHAHKLSGKVIRMSPFDADMNGRAARFFSRW